MRSKWVKLNIKKKKILIGQRQTSTCQCYIRKQACLIKGTNQQSKVHESHIRSAVWISDDSPATLCEWPWLGELHLLLGQSPTFLVQPWWKWEVRSESVIHHRNTVRGCNVSSEHGMLNPCWFGLREVCFFFLYIYTSNWNAFLKYNASSWTHRGFLGWLKLVFRRV